ncbi:hypothetical protein L7F22_066542 [Adiantum nelumboides]|nr:hypothetical protein [Adiantum nelumboides]
MGSGGPSTRVIVEAAAIAREKGPKRIGPFAVPKAMSSTASATLATWFKIRGRELFDLLGLRDLEPLHRQRRRDHPGRAPGHHLRGRVRGSRLDALGAVRRDGRDVVEVQRHALPRLARLRRQPRRLRDRGRRRRAGAGGIGARQGARRAHLRRGRGLRRHLGRARHGRALGRRRGALHAPGDGGPEGRAHRLHQPARHLDARRRRQGDRGDPRGLRRGRRLPADLGDEVAHRPLARRDRRAGGDLLAADDEQRLHLRERAYRRTRPGLRRHADPARAPRRRPTRPRDVELVRLRRHQRDVDP